MKKKSLIEYNKSITCIWRKRIYYKDVQTFNILLYENVVVANVQTTY